jgi:hypothetical protein
MLKRSNKQYRLAVAPDKLELLEQVDALKLERVKMKELLAEKDKEIQLLVIKFKEMSKGTQALSLSELQFVELQTIVKDGAESVALRLREARHLFEKTKQMHSSGEVSLPE